MRCGNRRPLVLRQRERRLAAVRGAGRGRWLAGASPRVVSAGVEGSGTRARSRGGVAGVGHFEDVALGTRRETEQGADARAKALVECAVFAAEDFAEDRSGRAQGGGGAFPGRTPGREDFGEAVRVRFSRVGVLQFAGQAGFDQDDAHALEAGAAPGQRRGEVALDADEQGWLRPGMKGSTCRPNPVGGRRNWGEVTGVHRGWEVRGWRGAKPG
ncbi:MAG: hypothetical protein M5U12_21020 [Verrucomicrobia bacterium]|nr:hypothetical protein [Verrucomicrobiota bacterium]